MNTRPDYVVILTDSLRLTTNKIVDNNPKARYIKCGRFTLDGIFYRVASAHTSSFRRIHPLRYIVDNNRHAPIHPEIWDYTRHYNKYMEKAHGEIKSPLCL